jgi:hypothetical protein
MDVGVIFDRLGQQFIKNILNRLSGAVSQLVTEYATLPIDTAIQKI